MEAKHSFGQHLESRLFLLNLIEEFSSDSSHSAAPSEASSTDRVIPAIEGDGLVCIQIMQEGGDDCPSHCAKFLELGWSQLDRSQLDAYALMVYNGYCRCFADAPSATEELSEASVTPLHLAAFFGNIQWIQNLVAAGCSPNAQTKKMHLTPLHVAVGCRNVEAVRLLLDLGADPSIPTATDGVTNAMHHFFETPKGPEGGLEILPALLGRMPNPEVTCDRIVLAAVYRCDQEFSDESGDDSWLDIAKLLIDKNLNLNKTGSGPSPIAFALHSNNLPLARALLASGRCRLHDDTPTVLARAVIHGDVEHVRLLLSHGADPNRCRLTRCFEYMAYADEDEKADGEDDLVASDGPMLLKEVAANGDLEIVQALVESGVQMVSTEAEEANLSAEMRGYTALHLAAWEGHQQVVAYLLSNGMGALVDARTGCGNTPFSLACHKGYAETANYLLSLNACDVFNADRDLDRPIHYACYQGMLDVVAALLARGESPSVRNRVNVTPVWNAAYRKHQSTVALLIKAGAELDVPSRGTDHFLNSESIFDEPVTPIEAALRSGSISIARLLALTSPTIPSFHLWDEARLPGVLAASGADRQWFINRAQNPRKLTEICRFHFHRRYGRRIRQLVDGLSFLSLDLCHYLLYDDLVSLLEKSLRVGEDAE